MIPDYCTQNAGDCPSCSLVNYGRDCQNYKIYNLGTLANKITGGNIRAMAKLLNDAGGAFDEIEPDPSAFVPRLVMVDLFAIRAGGREGRLLADLLGA